MMKPESSFKIVEIGIGHRMRYVRGDLIQDEFAEMLGVHRNTLTLWETGEQIPSTKHLMRLFELFKVNINWLLLGIGEPYLNEEQPKIITKKKTGIRMRRLGRDKKTGDFMSVREAKRRKKTATIQIIPLSRK